MPRTAPAVSTTLAARAADIIAGVLNAAPIKGKRLRQEWSESNILSLKREAAQRLQQLEDHALTTDSMRSLANIKLPPAVRHSLLSVLGNEMSTDSYRIVPTLVRKQLLELDHYLEEALRSTAAGRVAHCNAALDEGGSTAKN